VLHCDIPISQLTRVIEKTLTGTVAGVHAFGYDAAGNMTTMQKSGGTPNVVNVTTRAHNPLNQVTALSGGGATLVRGVLNEPGSASIAKAGQPLTPARMTAGNTFEEEFNLSTGQNTIAVRAEDATGNVSNYTFRTDIAPVTARAFTYDADGNMTSDGILTYEWDCLNRLTRINRGGTKATRFYYNALGQRVVIGEVDGTTFTDLKFLAWDGIQLLSLRKGPASSGYSGAKYERRYYPQGEQTIYQDPPTGNLSVTATHHYTRDHLGSVREVVKTDGTLQARYDYDPYGKRIAQYESTAYGTCPFGFTGHYTQKSPISVFWGQVLHRNIFISDRVLHCDIPISQLTRVIEKTLTGTVARGHAFGYDPAGNMTTMQKSGGTHHGRMLTAIPSILRPSESAPRFRYPRPIPPWALVTSPQTLPSVLTISPSFPSPWKASFTRRRFTLPADLIREITSWPM
jgi:YD repeat-containing protein